MKIIVFVEKEVRDTTEAGDLIKQIKAIATVTGFQVQDDAVKQEINDKVSEAKPE